MRTPTRSATTTSALLTPIAKPKTVRPRTIVHAPGHGSGEVVPALAITHSITPNTARIFRAALQKRQQAQSSHDCREIHHRDEIGRQPG
jgi:hypothetical protein